jgi:hypothetical protein
MRHDDFSIPVFDDGTPGPNALAVLDLDSDRSIHSTSQDHGGAAISRTFFPQSSEFASLMLSLADGRGSAG